MNEVLVIDVGGTKTRVAVLSNDSKKLEVQEYTNFPTFNNPNYEVQKIEEIYSTFVKKPSYMSLSLPGKWNKNGALKESLFLSSWIDFPFIERLATSLKIKKYLFETDVICGALGEYSALETHKLPLLYLNLGTGVGAAFIDKEGKPFKANYNLTLRMQNLVFPVGDKLGSAVDMISGGLILEQTNFKSTEELFKAYKEANVEAIDLISCAQTQLAAWLINLYYLFAPEIIVLNGGLTYDFDVIVEDAVDIAMEELGDDVIIIPSKLKEMAPLYGAYLSFSINAFWELPMQKGCKY